MSERRCVLEEVRPGPPSTSEADADGPRVTPAHAARSQRGPSRRRRVVRAGPLAQPGVGGEDRERAELDGRTCEGGGEAQCTGGKAGGEDVPAGGRRLHAYI